MTLKAIRKNIDLLDSKILNMLNERMELALMAKRFKSDIEDKEREKQLLERVRMDATGLVNAGFIESIYTEIIKESKKVQQGDHKLIGFQGEHGAYSEVAARSWNNNLVSVPCKEFVGVFEGVSSGLYDYGMVPVENTLGGVVGQVNELFIKTDLHVVGAVDLPVHHCLLVLPGTDYRDIRVVYSHSQALTQCRKFIARNKLEPLPFYNTAGAAKMLAETTPKASAVIASKLCAALYNLEIIKENIEDFDGNNTRFFALSGKTNREDGNKCSIIFTTEHKAGTLFKVLEVFAKANINLTRIGSIPLEPGNYAFFLDFMGSNRDEAVLMVLERVKEMSNSLKLLGCYNEEKIE